MAPTVPVEYRRLRGDAVAGIAVMIEGIESSVRLRPTPDRHRRATYLIDDVAGLEKIAGVTAERKARLVDRDRAVPDRGEWRAVGPTRRCPDDA